MFGSNKDCTPSTILPKALRVIAIILEHVSSIDTAHTIATMILHKLDPMLHLMDHAADTMQEAVEDTRKATDCLYRTGQETRDKLQKCLETMKDNLLRTTEDIKEGIGKLTEAATATANNVSGTLT